MILFSISLILGLTRAEERNTYFVLKVNPDASWSLDAGQGVTLESGNYMLHRNDKYYSTTDGSLQIDQVTDNRRGTDNLGKYLEYVFKFTTPDPEVAINAYIREYSDIQTVVFGQHFYPVWDGIGIENGIDLVSTAFPSIKIPEKSDMFYFNPCGSQAGYNDMRNGSWDAANSTNMCGGRDGGPFFIFDKYDPSVEYFGKVFGISSFSNFMDQNTVVQKYLNELWFGLKSSISALPQNGFDIQTVITMGDKGFYNGVQKWGETLLKRYGKTKERKNQDFSVNYLSYFTSDGAYYYDHKMDPSTPYEETFISLALTQENVPFKSWEIDSWFYEQDKNGNVISWNPKPSDFPNGLSGLFSETKVPLIAKNGIFSGETVYADSYTFIIDTKTNQAYPKDNGFWKDLFKNSTNWGLRWFLQDNLDEQMNGVDYLNLNPTAARNWLLSLDQGASENDINIIFGSAWPRHMLQSVEMPSVTSIRVSKDYQPGNYQWDIGVSAIYTNALGLAPFKDVFWTTPDQPGNPRYKNMSEIRAELQAAIATFSTGIVAVGDKIDETDLKLLHKSIMPNGRILKPSYPMVIPDYLIWTLDTKKYLNGTTEYETMCTVSGISWGIVLGYAETNTLENRLLDIKNYKFFDKSVEEYRAVSLMKHENGDIFEKSQIWSKNKPLEIGSKEIPTKHEGFLLMIYISPIWQMSNHSVSFSGEIFHKWSIMSPDRFTSVNPDPHHIYIDMTGVPEELIQLDFEIDRKTMKANCTVPASGKLSFNFVLPDPEKEVYFYCQDN